MSLPRFLHRWPPVRTKPGLSRKLRFRATLFGALGAVFIPWGFGIILSLLSALLNVIGLGYLGTTGLQTILVWSTLLSIPFSLAAMLFAFLAITYGYAGWLIAVTLGGAVVAAVSPDTPLLFFLIGCAYGFVFWLTARVTTPDAFTQNP